LAVSFAEAGSPLQRATLLRCCGDKLEMLMKALWKVVPLINPGLDHAQHLGLQTAEHDV
jgi:hypothetical protein